MAKTIPAKRYLTLGVCAVSMSETTKVGSFSIKGGEMEANTTTRPQFRIRLSDGVSASGKRAYDYTLEVTFQPDAECVESEDGQELEEFLARYTMMILRRRDVLQAEIEARTAL